jgi:hypothetical protein
MLVEMVGPCRVRVHPDLEDSISRAAAGQRPHTQVRRYDAAQDQVWVTFETLEAAQQAASRIKVEDKQQDTPEVGAHGTPAAAPAESSSHIGTEQASIPVGVVVTPLEAEPDRRRRRLFGGDDD